MLSATLHRRINYNKLYKGLSVCCRPPCTDELITNKMYKGLSVCCRPPCTDELITNNCIRGCLFVVGHPAPTNPGSNWTRETKSASPGEVQGCICILIFSSSRAIIFPKKRSWFNCKLSLQVIIYF